MSEVTADMMTVYLRLLILRRYPHVEAQFINIEFENNSRSHYEVHKGGNGSVRLVVGDYPTAPRFWETLDRAVGAAQDMLRQHSHAVSIVSTIGGGE